MAVLEFKLVSNHRALVTFDVKDDPYMALYAVAIDVHEDYVRVGNPKAAVLHQYGLTHTEIELATGLILGQRVTLKQESIGTEEGSDIDHPLIHRTWESYEYSKEPNLC